MKRRGKSAAIFVIFFLLISFNVCIADAGGQDGGYACGGGGQGIVQGQRQGHMGGQDEQGEGGMGQGQGNMQGQDRGKGQEKNEVKGQNQGQGQGQNVNAPIFQENPNWVPPGLSKEERSQWVNGTPPGWTKGNKTGWDGSPMPPGLMKKYPPGFNSWSVGQRQRWELDLNLAKQHVHIEVIKYRGRSQQDIISAEISVEAAARSGVPIANVESLVVDCVRRGFDSDTIEKASRALTYGVGRDIDFNKVGSAARARIDAGVSGDSLAKDIYKNILLQEYENKIEQQKPRKNKQQK